MTNPLHGFGKNTSGTSRRHSRVIRDVFAVFLAGVMIATGFWLAAHQPAQAQPGPQQQKLQFGGFIPQQQKPVDPNAEQPNAEGDMPGTPLHTDRSLLRLLKQADDFADSGHYDEAIRVWQRVLDVANNELVFERTSNGLVPLEPEMEQKRDTVYYKNYRPIRREIEERLRALPADVFDSYQTLITADARGLLNRDDPSTVDNEILTRFFLSEIGDDAALRLMAIARDQGDFVTASRLMQRVLTQHPGPGSGRGNLLLQYAFLARQLQDDRLADEALRLFEENQNDDPLPPSETVLQAARSQHSVIEPTRTTNRWPFAWGTPARNGQQQNPTDLEFGEPLTEDWVCPFDFALEDQRPLAGAGNGNGITIVRGAIPVGGRILLSRKTVTKTLAVSLPPGEAWIKSGWRPTTRLHRAHGRIYFYGSERVICCDENTGQLVWMGRRNQYEIDRLSSQFGSSGANSQNPRPKSVQEIRLFGDQVRPSICVDRQVLYCLEGNPLDFNDPQGSGLKTATVTYPYNMRRSRSNRLTAYDAHTGKLLWQRAANDENIEPDQIYGFLSVPVPHRDSLIIPVTRNGELWLSSLNRNDGSTQWSVYLCDEPQEGASPWTPVALTIDGSDVYVGSGFGLIFAVEAANGRTLWATRYSRNGLRTIAANVRVNTNVNADLDAWEDNVLLVQGRHLVVVTSDCDHVFGLDRRNGHMLWDSPRTPPSGSDAVEPPGEICLGLAGDRFIVAGREVVRCYRVAGGRMLWSVPLTNSLGRGLIAQNSLLIPDENDVVMLSLEDGSELARTTLLTPTDEPLGNLLSDGEKLMVVGMSRVFAVGRLSRVMERLTRSIGAGDGYAARDRMRLRERMGDTDGAIADMQQAVKLLRNKNGLRSGREMLLDSLQELALATDQPVLTLKLLTEDVRLTQASPDGTGAIAPADANTAWNAEEIKRRNQLFYTALKTIELAGTPRAELLRRQKARRPPSRPIHQPAVAEPPPAVAEPRQREAATEVAPVDENSCDPVEAPALRKVIQIRQVQRAQIQRAQIQRAQFEVPEYRPRDTSTMPAEENPGEQADTAEAQRPAASPKEIRERIRMIFEIAPLLDQPHLVVAATRAVEANVTPAEWSFLQERFTSPAETTRIIALQGLLQIEHESLLPQLQLALKDPSDRIQRRAAEELAVRQQRDVLPVLAKLVNSEDITVRVGAHQSLQALTGHQIPFIAYEAPEKRAVVVDKWLSWLDGPGRYVALRELTPMTTFQGRTLCTDYEKNRVYELDSEGKEIWSKSGISGAWGCCHLANGNHLVTAIRTKSVFELDGTGKVVGEKSGLAGAPYSAQRLPNGHTLVACSDGKIYELDSLGKGGKVVREIKVDGTPRYARQIENGNILVALYNKNMVVEIDPNDREVNTFKGLERPIVVEKLNSGNLLILEYTGKRRIVELNLAGKVVREQQASTTTVFHAQRLPNGHTLVVDNNGLTEMDLNGKVVKKQSLKGLRCAHRY